MKALVVFSGGQDSTTCLAYALANYDEVETVGFYYGQRHSVELICRQNVLKKIREEFPELASKLGKDTVIDVSSFGQIADSALTRPEEKIEDGDNGLPTSFVPGRNILFLTYAGSMAYCRKADTIITGVCETDYSGYPDCRGATIYAIQMALSLGMDREIFIDTPLMHLTKAQTWELAEKCGGKKMVDLIVRETHTCYEGDHEHFHDWGYGCGECPACKLREKGYREYAEGKK